MDSQLQDIGMLVAEQAYDIFKQCGAMEDFCIQSVGSAAVFGGTNRLVWSLAHGFVAERTYCTESFLDAVKSVDGVEVSK